MRRISHRPKTICPTCYGISGNHWAGCPDDDRPDDEEDTVVVEGLDEIASVEDSPDYDCGSQYPNE